jgi:hypothetical protein
MVTFLFHAVGGKNLKEVVGAFYDLNQDVFTDSREQHMEECDAHLNACSKTWFEKLPADERKHVADLPEEYQVSFRICRDLATREDEHCPPGQFFMSYRELARRIGTRQKSAERILATFIGQGWIKIHTKGTRYEAGSKPKATQYLWMLGDTVRINSTK